MGTTLAAVIAFVLGPILVLLASVLLLREFRFRRRAITTTGVVRQRTTERSPWWLRARGLALVQSGWQWTETSAFTIDTDDLASIWRGAALVARQAKPSRGTERPVFGSARRRA